MLEAAAGRKGSVSIYGTDYPTRDGTAIRDYIHVEDLARAHLLALEGNGGAKSGEHRIYNLGNGSGFSVREVVETVREVTERGIKAGTALYFAARGLPISFSSSSAVVF